MNDSLTTLPGGDLIQKGLRDFQDGLQTVESLLVEICSPQLVAARLLQVQSHKLTSELELYRLLQKTERNPYSKYNSLLRLLSSFKQALRRNYSN